MREEEKVCCSLTLFFALVLSSIVERGKRRNTPLSLFPFPLFSLQALVAMSPQLIETTESDTRVVVARFVAALAAGKVRNREERFDGWRPFFFHRCLPSASSSFSSPVSLSPLISAVHCVSRTQRRCSIPPSRVEISTPMKNKHTGCGFGSCGGDDQQHRVRRRVVVVSGRGRRGQRQDGRVRHGPRGAAPRRLREGRGQR